MSDTITIEIPARLSLALRSALTEYRNNHERKARAAAEKKKPEPIVVLNTVKASEANELVGIVDANLRFVTAIQSKRDLIAEIKQRSAEARERREGATK
jgi:hypothetical protein